MLAPDDITLQLDGATLRLRPSLRAAVRLERQFDGFAGLLAKITEGSVSAFVALAVECGHRRHEAAILAPSSEAWSARYARLSPQLVALTFQLADVDPQAKPGPRIERPSTGRKVTHAEALAELFGIATGVLGWSPAIAWSATPAEIKAALDAHTRMLRAQAGMPEPESSDPFNDTLDSAGLAELAAL